MNRNRRGAAATAAGASAIGNDAAPHARGKDSTTIV